MAAALEPDLRLQVGKYDVQKLLGKGATGSVYLARDAFTGREVALKTLEPELFRDPELGAVHRTQFLNEASLAGKLRHPHIVGILDAVVGEDSGHLAMELVTGGDLSQHVRPGRLLPPADVLEIAFKCCRAMEYAYREHGVVHRDLKPSNIMIVRGTDIKIADFGAAFLRRGPGGQTAALGSPSYMAPEHMQGAEPTLRSDMYSLGVVLYQLLVGRRPFQAATLEALIRETLHTDPVPPSKVNPALSRDIDPVVLRALRKDPSERYVSWAQFAVELSRLGSLLAPPGAVAESEKYLALSAVEMLKTLSDHELWEVAAGGRWRRFERGAVIVKEEAPGQSFFFLGKGQAKVTRHGRLLNMIKQGECFGEMAFIRGGHEPRHATVEASTEVMIAEFAPEALEAMSHPAQLHLMRALVRNAVERLALANSRSTR